MSNLLLYVYLCNHYKNKIINLKSFMTQMPEVTNKGIQLNEINTSSSKKQL